MATSEEMLFILKMQDSASSTFTAFTRTVSDAGKAANDTKASISDLSAALTGAAVAFGALGAGSSIIKGTLGVFREYELGIANIQKVSGIGGEAVHEFSARFDDLARSMPVPLKTLQEIAYTAGSLGVQGTENILAVTKAVAELGTTTNLSGEKAILALTQLTNIMHEAPTEAGRLASQIVSLDNVTAASAASIARMGKEVGLATSVFNIGSGAAVAIGAAMSDMGIRAERGGTAVGRVFTALDQATRNVPGMQKGLSDLEKLFGDTAAQLRQMELADPTKFFTDFIGRLHDVEVQGGNYYVLLKDLGLGQRETASSIVPLANNYEKLASNLNRVAVEAKYTTAQAREFEIFLQTLDSRIKMLGNSFTLFEKDLGAALGPTAKTTVTGLTGVVNQLDAAFKALPASWQTFIVSEASVLGTVIALTTAVQALATVFKVLNLAVLSNGWLLAATAVLAAGAAYLSFNQSAEATIELTQQETTKLAMLASGTNDAKVALEGLTSAQAQNLTLALNAKIDEVTSSFKGLNNQIVAASGPQGFWARIAAGDGVFDAQQQKLAALALQWRNGTLSVDDYRQELFSMAQADPQFKAQATQILALVTQWTDASDKVEKYKEMLARIGETSKYPAQGPQKTGEPLGPPVPDKFAGEDPTISASKQTQIDDFNRATQQKIEGFARETAALKESTAAYKLQKKEEQENAEVEQVLKRGRDLGIASIEGMTKAYRAALEARDSAKMARDAQDEVALVNKKIQAFKDEDEALKKGAKAYEDYKLQAKLEPQIDSIRATLEGLGMETEAINKLTDAYRAAGIANAQMQEKAKQDAAAQKQIGEIAKGVATEFTKMGEALLTSGAKFSTLANQFAAAITKMVAQTLLLKPLQDALSNLLTGQVTPGSTGGGYSSQGAGIGGGLLGAALGGLKSLFGGAVGADGVSAAGQTVPEAAFDDFATAGGTSAAGSGGLFSSISSWAAALFHTGGVVGEQSVIRDVNPGMFAGAPRYHTGLGNDEFAAILQRGERVLTANQNDRMTDTINGLSNQMQAAQQAASRQPVIHQHWNITTPDADSFGRSQNQILGRAGSVMAMAARRS